MMRALWTAGSGMMAQQLNVDVISNNLANVNTVGFKKERAEFKDLLYETLDRANVLDGTGKPVNLQVGHGAMVTATVKNFSTGNLDRTENPLDFAIDGEGFFMVMGPKQQLVFTRDGGFKVTPSDTGKKLTTSDGYPILDENGQEIYLDFDISKMSVSEEGDISYIDEDGLVVPLGQRIGLFQFPNRAGLESIGSNFFVTTPGSGEPFLDSEGGARSAIRQRFIEGSNVQVVEEMVKLIVAQRAYEINSKAIQSSDDMLGIANNLRR